MGDKIILDVDQMKLREFEGKFVKIRLKDGTEHEGRVMDFIFAEDNNPQKNSIIVDESNNNGGQFIEFYEDDIETIK